MPYGRKLYRSRHGELLGVCQGIADWRELPVGPIRLLVIIIAVSTAVVPVLAIYIAAGFLLPLEPTGQQRREARGGFWGRQSREEFKDSFRKDRHHTVHDIKDEFEDLKEKVSKMEADVFDKEKEWDNKFHSSDTDRQ